MIDESDLLLKHPSTVVVAGPTGCGKTRLVNRLLTEQLIYPFPKRVVWVYGEWQATYEELRAVLPHIEFVSEMTGDTYQSMDPKTTNLLVLDDQMDVLGDSKELVKMFIKGSHHRNLTIIYIIQNIFDQGKAMRPVALNTHYTFLFENPRDGRQVQAVASQMFPRNPHFFVDVFADATREPFGYVMVDTRPGTRQDLRVRSHIFRGEQQVVYMPARKV